MMSSYSTRITPTMMSYEHGLTSRMDVLAVIYGCIVTVDFKSCYMSVYPSPGCLQCVYMKIIFDGSFIFSLSSGL